VQPVRPSASTTASSRAVKRVCSIDIPPCPTGGLFNFSVAQRRKYCNRKRQKWKRPPGGRSFFCAFRSGFAQVLDQGEDAEHYQDDQADEQQDIEQLGKDGGIHSGRSFPGRG